MIFIMVVLLHGDLIVVSSAILYQKVFKLSCYLIQMFGSIRQGLNLNFPFIYPPRFERKQQRYLSKESNTEPAYCVWLHYCFFKHIADSLFYWAQCWLKHWLGNWTGHSQSVEKSRILSFNEHSDDYGSIVQRIWGKLTQLLVHCLFTEFNAVDKLLTTLADCIRSCIHATLHCITARIKTQTVCVFCSTSLKSVGMCNEGTGSAAALVQDGASLNW